MQLIVWKKEKYLNEAFLSRFFRYKELLFRHTQDQQLLLHYNCTPILSHNHSINLN